MIRIKQFDVGAKTVGNFYNAYLTMRHIDIDGLPFSQILANGQRRNSLSVASGYGLEFDVAMGPVNNLQIAFTGDYQSSSYHNFGEGSEARTDGDQVPRQPRLKVRLTPSYRTEGVGRRQAARDPQPDWQALFSGRQVLQFSYITARPQKILLHHQIA